MTLRTNRHSLFIPFFILFLFCATALIAFTSQILVDKTNVYSYILGSVAIAMFAKTFLVSYANISYSLDSQRWFVFGVDILLLCFQVWMIYQGFVSLTNTSFPRDTFLYFTLASTGFTTQLLLGKLSRMIRIGFWDILYHISVLFILNIFVLSDLRVWQSVSVFALLLELFYVFNLLRTLQKTEQITIYS